MTDEITAADIDADPSLVGVEQAQTPSHDDEQTPTPTWADIFAHAHASCEELSDTQLETALVAIDGTGVQTSGEAGDLIDSAVGTSLVPRKLSAGAADATAGYRLGDGDVEVSR